MLVSKPTTLPALSHSYLTTHTELPTPLSSTAPFPVRGGSLVVPASASVGASGPRPPVPASATSGISSAPPPAAPAPRPAVGGAGEPPTAAGAGSALPLPAVALPRTGAA